MDSTVPTLSFATLGALRDHLSQCNSVQMTSRRPPIKPDGTHDSVNARGGKFDTALKAASLGGHKRVTQFLLANGSDFKREDRGRLLWVVEYGYREVVQLLFANDNEDNVQGGNYGTALPVASADGQVEVVRFLLKHGADVNARDGNYNTALQKTKEKGGGRRRRRARSTIVAGTPGVRIEPSENVFRKVMARLKDARREDLRGRDHGEAQGAVGGPGVSSSCPCPCIIAFVWQKKSKDEEHEDENKRQKRKNSSHPKETMGMSTLKEVIISLEVLVAQAERRSCVVPKRPGESQRAQEDDPDQWRCTMAVSLMAQTLRPEEEEEAPKFKKIFVTVTGHQGHIRICEKNHEIAQRPPKNPVFRRRGAFGTALSHLRPLIAKKAAGLRANAQKKGPVRFGVL
ncbi:hypothetical protein FB451DRAFT_1362598 [Mycena latifolia]|nr:hypothetical protein FB451DRAFT_1362598 [Mycena latifolia]